MEQQPLITIVIPVRNRAGIVNRTLQSIASQSYRPLRVILVDNNSTDQTMHILEQWRENHSSPNFQIDILQETTTGASAARNRGLRDVASEYVMFFDSDDEMRHDHLASIAQELSARQDTDILYWDTAIIDQDGWMHIKNQTDIDLLRCHIFHGTLSTQRYIARTNTIKHAGGWNESLSTWDDLELGTRLLTSGATIRKLNGEPKVLIHPTADSITGPNYSSRSHQQEKSLDAIEAHLSDAGYSNHINYIDARRTILAAHYRSEGAKDDAARLLNRVLEKTSKAHILKHRLIYAVERVAGCGGSTLASILFNHNNSGKNQ